ncbi:MAG: hydrogenase maturation protease [Chloroflexi bacterium]|nr:hydrogenase maturation protease [Chloroflexota bacterium]
MDNEKKILVIGLGNPILGDDGVGWHVVRAAQTEWQARGEQAGVEFETLSTGGLALMERMEGYCRVLVIDAASSGGSPIGSVSSKPLSALEEFPAAHTRSAHDTSLRLALEVGGRLGIPLPEEVWVVGVEIEPDFEFSEALSLPVAEAVQEAKDLALCHLNAWVAAQHRKTDSRASPGRAGPEIARGNRRPCQ